MGPVLGAVLGGKASSPLYQIFSHHTQTNAHTHMHLVKRAMQLLINRYRYARFAEVPERGSTKSFVVLSIGYSNSNHLSAPGTFNMNPFLCNGSISLAPYWVPCSAGKPTPSYTKCSSPTDRHTHTRARARARVRARTQLKVPCALK